MAYEGFQRIQLADVTFGKFLGSGGFGGVRLASHKSWGDIAVKEFNNIALTKEVRKEAEKMLRVIHSPYMVRVLGLMEDHVNLCIVMEYFKYGSLKSFQGKYMDCACWPRKVKMMLDIALGMNYLHTLNPPIIHRDLKLDNIFVASGFDIKIGDLGLAISVTSSSVKYFDPDSIMGTCSHIPPEIWEGLVEIPDEFWDIYTFAITMYEFLSGKDPWQAFANDSLISMWVLRGLRPDVAEIPAEAPAELIDIMKRCWNGTPTERPTFQAIQEEISRVYQSRYEIDLDDADFAIMQQKRRGATTDDKYDSLSRQVGSIGQDIAHQKSNSLESNVSRLRISSHAQPDSCKKDGEKTDPAALLKSSGNRRSVTPAGAHSTHEKWPLHQGIPTSACNVHQWRIIKEFGKKGEAPGKILFARCIAVCKNSDVIVVDLVKPRYKVYVFSNDGVYKPTIESPVAIPEGKLTYPLGVGILASGQIAIGDCTSKSDTAKYIKVFNANGTYQRRFCTLTPDEPPHTKVAITSIAVSPDGTILVGDRHRKVTIHDGSDGAWKQKVYLGIEPVDLTTNSRKHIIASDFQLRKVVCVDYAGIEVFALDNFLVDGSPGLPSGLTCGDDDTLYVAVSKLQEKTDRVRCLNTGHIHQYSASGRFIQCIIKGLYSPRGIIWHTGSIYIADSRSVVVLGKS